MKILQIVPSISLIYGGPSQMVIGLSQALATAGEKVTILTTNSNGDAGQPPLDVPLFKPILQDGYQIIYFPCSPFRRYKFSLPLLQWLSHQAKHYDIAHIHALFSPISTAASMVARNQQLPYILRPLGTLDPADLTKKKNLKKLYGWLLERHNLARASAIHFTSEQEAQISERYGIKTQDLVIPLGVSLPNNIPPIGQTRQKFGIPDHTPLILFMSRIDPKKGLSLLIQSLENLIDKEIDFHFILAGSNPQDPTYENEIKQKIQTSKLSLQTTLTGFVQGDLKLGLLRDADLFVLPSYYENFGIAVAEAMAMGNPVIVSDQVHIWPAIEEAEGGWICRCDVASLTDTLITALKHPQVLKERGQNARYLTNTQYSWPAIAQQMIQAYQHLCCH